MALPIAYQQFPGHNVGTPKGNIHINLTCIIIVSILLHGKTDLYNTEDLKSYNPQVSIYLYTGPIKPK